MTDTRVAVVGCGGMGRHHLDVLAEMDEFVTVGLCDVSAEALAASGDKYAVADRFTDIEELLDKAGPDIVVVATQTRHHHEPTVAALKRGVSVLCEKPISIDLREADDMVEAARAINGTPDEFGDWQPVDLGEVNARNSTIAYMYRAFAAAIEADVEPPASGAEGRMAFEMILGIYQSHREQGRRVALPLAERQHPLEAWLEEA